MKLKIERIIFGILAIITFVTIFMFSNENGEKSSSTSERFVRTIINVLPSTKNIDEIQKEEIIENSQFVIRKLAHFTIYLIAGINVAGFINTFNKISLKNKLLISLLICITYAISDEIHQMFSDGRTAKITDILIDSCGSMLGIWLMLKIRKNIDKKYKKIYN